MRIIIVCCLFLSIIFLLLARANKSRKKTWVKAFRLKATVTRIRYSESRPSRDIIDDDKSSTEVTLGFSCLGQDYEKIREYKGILKAPSRPGIRLPILFDPATKNWYLSREARPFWILHLILAAFFLITAIAFIFRGNYILTELSDYHVEAPNLTGGIFLGILGVFVLAAAIVCFIFFIPLCFRPFFDPILWSIKYVLGAFEPVEARCTGLIRKDKGEDGYSYYPLFAYTDPQRGRMQWHTSREKPKKRFQMGEIYTLYLSKKSGVCSLMPSSSEIVSIIFSIVPAGFALFFTVSLAFVAVVLLYCAVISF